LPPRSGSEAARAFSRAWDRHFRLRRKLTIEALLRWVYRDQKVIEITGRSLYAGEVVKGERWVRQQCVSGDGCIAVERNSQVGCPIDGGGPVRGIAQPLHQDAETVHEIVLSLPFEASGQLINYGRTGEAPEPPPAPHFRQVLDFDRRWKVKVVSRYDFDTKEVLRWCPVQLYPDERTAADMLQAFRSWGVALELLRDALADVQLRHHEVISRD
jgi:hypothetical protein